MIFFGSRTWWLLAIGRTEERSVEKAVRSASRGNQQ